MMLGARQCGRNGPYLPRDGVPYYHEIFASEPRTKIYGNKGKFYLTLPSLVSRLYECQGRYFSRLALLFVLLS
jgi:hypothetical protein